MPRRPFGRDGSARRSRWYLRAAVLMVAIAASPAAASADTLTLAATPAKPSGVTPVTITASGDTGSPNATVIVAVNPASSPCPTDYADDGNGYWIDLSGQTGAYTVHSFPEQLEHGSYEICGWLVSTASPATSLATSSQSLTVSNPDSLTVTVAPPSVIDGGSATVSISGVADVQHPEVFVTEQPAAGGSCAAYPAADRGTPLPGYDPAAVSFGSFSEQRTELPGAGDTGRADGLAAGRYLLCGWLMDSEGSSRVPLASPAAAIVTLSSPTGRLAFSIPEVVGAGKRFTVTTSIASDQKDVGLYLDLKPLPAHGPPCASSPALEPRDARFLFLDDHGATLTKRARLTRAGVYVACAWLEWVHGTIDGPFSGRVVVLARHQHAAEFLGITSQRLRRRQLQSDYPISFGRVDGEIVDMSYFARYTCIRAHHRTTHPIYSTTFPAFPVVSTGRFLDSFAQGTDTSVVGGRIRGNRATGRFSETYISGGYVCRSGTVTFSARAG